MKTVNFNKVVIKDEFWSARQRQFILKVIDTGIRNISVRHKEAPNRSGGLENFLQAARKHGCFGGTAAADYDPYFRSGEKQHDLYNNLYFVDTDTYKIIEAMSYALLLDPEEDDEIKAQQERFKHLLDTWIGWIEGAQEVYEAGDNLERGEYDGYLQTYFTLDLDNEWQNTIRHERFQDLSLHELYCFGHFYEAAAAYTRATHYQDLRLLKVAVRNADMVERLFGWGRWEAYPGHQEIELALVKLALTCEEVESAYRQKQEPLAVFLGKTYGERRESYLKLAKFFLDMRGRTMNRGAFLDDLASDPYYRQNWLPVTKQRIAAGHAVRAMYQYVGMADIETYLETDEYDEALDAIWQDIQMKTYVTGGIGAVGEGASAEGFGAPYYLPNDNAYAETCANIGSMMWGQRMNLLRHDKKYIDTVETALYNGVISGVDFAGEAFFYGNPMSSRGDKQRSAWFGCACCPPNLMRTITSLGGYIYAHDEKRVFVNLYIGNTAQIQLAKDNLVKLCLQTNMPWQGQVTISVPEADKDFDLCLRIPAWAKGKPIINKKGGAENTGNAVSYDQENGYIILPAGRGDVWDITYPLCTTRYYSPEQVTGNRGLAAVTRGPVVFAAEGVDNIKNGENLAQTAVLTGDFKEEMVSNVLRDERPDKYGLKKGMIIYGDAKLGEKKEKMVFIPYYAWNNRGKDAMDVFVKDNHSPYL